MYTQENWPGNKNSFHIRPCCTQVSQSSTSDFLLYFYLGPRTDSHDEIDRLTKELVDTVEQRNALVEMLEEDRIR